MDLFKEVFKALASAKPITVPRKTSGRLDGLGMADLKSDWLSQLTMTTTIITSMG